ncbi:Na/Pi cotransporter family protein [Vibrio sinaloensis]|uniref:Na/Pi cotransporter family protein n=1 Tax=Photobacterium sp. (strain ATCC 43367) TaxID=379097 RepID=UPI00204C8023|nr:Na/Pi cotransporter family protein [Vibrio sinaloensis]UPQ89125.1 Na/Pi cotransporter family protein [Vibrio sinaloensis]
MNRILIALILVCSSFPAFSNNTALVELDYTSMSMGLFGGLAMFLYGMEKMADALKRAAGSRMKQVLGTLTTNRVSSVITGAGLTAVIQSSSVTTVLLVGFVSAGLMSLNQAVGVIMGANIGTTITAQIIAFKVTKAAMAMIAIGFVIEMTSKQQQNKNYGNIIFGLGLLFLGMNLMSEAMSPLRVFQPFIDFMAKMDNPVFAILLAASFTALVQSSSATTGIVIMLASQGFISLESGIAMSMGANIGTCVTALLAAIGKSTEAKQTSAIHLLFNLVGVIIWLPLIAVLANVSASISPSYPDLVGMERLAVESPRQIANANTLFNVANTLIMLPFSTFFVLSVKRLIPHKTSNKEKQKIAPKYIKSEYLATPDIALEQAHLEIARVGRRVSNMVNQLPPLAANYTNDRDKQSARQTLREIEKVEDEVDMLHGQILSYLGRLRQSPLSSNESRQQIKLVSITDQLESIADLVVNAMLPLCYKTLDGSISASPEMRKTLDLTQSRVNRALLDSVNAIRRGDNQLAENVLNAKREINALLDSILQLQAERLAQATEKRLDIFRIQMEWVESLKRIYTLSKRIAKLQLRNSAD